MTVHLKSQRMQNTAERERERECKSWLFECRKGTAAREPVQPPCASAAQELTHKRLRGCFHAETPRAGNLTEAQWKRKWQPKQGQIEQPLGDLYVQGGGAGNVCLRRRKKKKTHPEISPLMCAPSLKMTTQLRRWMGPLLVRGTPAPMDAPMGGNKCQIYWSHCTHWLSWGCLQPVESTWPEQGLWQVIFWQD